MGHPLGSFIKDLLASVDDRREPVSLVVDNARMAINTPKSRALRKRFRPVSSKDASTTQRLVVPSHFIRRPVRKPSLDVSDHTRGETRWGSTTPSAPVTTKRQEAPRPIRSHSYSPVQREMKQLSPVVEEPRKMELRLGSKQLQLANGSSLLQLQKPDLVRRSQTRPLKSVSDPGRRSADRKTLHQVEEALAICGKV